MTVCCAARVFHDRLAVGIAVRFVEYDLVSVKFGDLVTVCRRSGSGACLLDQRGGEERGQQLGIFAELSAFDLFFCFVKGAVNKLRTLGEQDVLGGGGGA